MLKALVLAVALAVAAPAPVLKDEQYLGTQFGICPDGSALQVDLYDPDPSDPDALLIVFRRETGIVAILDDKNKQLWVSARQAWLPLAEAAGLWATPCQLPAPGTPT